MWLIWITIAYVIFRFIGDVLIDYYKSKAAYEKRMMQWEYEQWIIEQANKQDSDYMQSYLPQLEEILDKNNIELKDE